MADGYRSFNFPAPQRSRLRPGEIVLDLFAGGSASEGLKQALGIDPALPYNHDELAIGMHAANHPLTSHHREDIWHADPRVDVAGRPYSGRASMLAERFRYLGENGALRSRQRVSTRNEISPLQGRDRNATDLHRQQSPLGRTTSPKVGRIALPFNRQRDAVKRLR